MKKGECCITRRQCWQIDGQQATVSDDEAPAYHDIRHARAVLAHDHLRNRFIQRDQRGRIEIEEHDIGGIARRDPADPLEAERTRAAGRSGGEYLRRGDPACRIGPARVRCRRDCL